MGQGLGHGMGHRMGHGMRPDMGQWAGHGKGHSMIYGMGQGIGQGMGQGMGPFTPHHPMTPLNPHIHTHHVGNSGIDAPWMVKPTPKAPGPMGTEGNPGAVPLVNQMVQKVVHPVFVPIIPGEGPSPVAGVPFINMGIGPNGNNQGHGQGLVRTVKVYTVV
jgi:hypothetical protein